MHSKIFQISSKPIDRDDYKCPDDYYDNSSEFADYIGDEMKGERREECIGYLALNLSDLFSYDGEAFVYKGNDAMHAFNKKWIDAIKESAGDLTDENLLFNLYRLRKLTKSTHKESSFRFDIEEWNGWAGPMYDIVDYAASRLKEGDRIYVGAVIDYHY